MNSIVDRITSFLEGADAARESDSERDGILSYAREWHALGIGAGAGFAAVAGGDVGLATAVASAAIAGDRGRRRLTKKALINVRSEGWYAVGGLAVGGAVGVAYRGTDALGGLLP